MKAHQQRERCFGALSDVRTNAELTGAAAAGVRWTALVRIVAESLLLGSMVVLARVIPPSAFGMFAVAVIVQELAMNVPSEGVGSALVQLRTVEREHLQAGFALSLLVGIALAVVTLLLAGFVVQPLLGSETAYLVALTTPWFLLGAILALPLTVLRRRLDFRSLSILALTQSTIRAGSTILFAVVLGLDASALVLGGLAGMCVMVVVALVFAPVPLPRWRSRFVRDLLPYSVPAMLATFSWAGFRNGDYAIVGARLGVTQAGFYWRGYQLAVEYQSKVSAVMSQVAFPVMARTAGHEEMFVLRRRMARLLTVAVFPMLVSLTVLAPVIVPWLFGPAWIPAVVPTQILAAGGAATVVIDGVGAVLMAAGRARAMLGYGVAHFVVYAGAVVFASSYGLVGVSVAAGVVHSAFVIVAYQVLLRDRVKRTLRFMWEDLSAASISCVAFLVVAWPLNVALARAGVAAPLQVLLVSAAGLMAYVAVLRTWFPAAWGDLVALLRRLLPAWRLRRAMPVHET
jgi:lipopolysaccharide exporter